MVEAVESGADMMQAEAREMEVFRYVESPWIEPAFAAGDPQPVLFAGSEGLESNRRPGPDMNPAGIPDRERRREPFTERYIYGIDPSCISTDEITDSSLNGDRQDQERGATRESEDQELFQQLLSTESHKAEERGQSKGMEMGLNLGREEALRQLQGERERLVNQAAVLMESFSSVRESYLHQLEQEAVKLALAIAARILRREAQSDPLLLTGAVRVALSQLARSTTVRLLVPAQDQSMWEEALSFLPGLSIRPQVIGTTELQLGECVIETEISSADLGVWSQLKSLEKEFFDRVEDRLAVGESGNEAGDSGQINAINRAILDLSPEKLSDDCNQMVQEEKN